MARFVIFGCLLTLSIAQASFAQPSLNTFLDKWVQAVQKRDPVAYRALIHPASKACLAGENQDFMSRHIQTRLSTSLQVAPQISLMPLGRGDLGLKESDLFSYAVRPTHVATINLGRQTIAVGIAGTKYQWLEVLPCPNSIGLKQLRLQWGLADRFAPIAALKYF